MLEGKTSKENKKSVDEWRREDKGKGGKKNVQRVGFNEEDQGKWDTGTIWDSEKKTNLFTTFIPLNIGRQK